MKRRQNGAARGGCTRGGTSYDAVEALADRALDTALEAASARPSTARPLLRRGSRGAAVARLQRLLAGAGLRLRVDGVFGARTDAAVRRLQRGRRLVVDGIVGPQTWAALLGRRQAVPGAPRPARPGGPGTAPAQPTGLIWPVDGRLTSPFGPRIHPVTGEFQSLHNGIDIAAPIGTPVRAAAAGTASPGQDAISGNYVYVRHDGMSSSYSHLSRVNVRSGQRVAQGEVVGWVGATGRATGPHLHFRVNNARGEPVDPIALLPPRNGQRVAERARAAALADRLVG